MGENAGRDAEDVAGAMQLLADATRLRILLLLGGGRLYVGELVTRLGIPQPTLSHHLALLRAAGLVQSRRDGKRVYYSLTWPPPTAGAVRVNAGGCSVTVNVLAG